MINVPPSSSNSSEISSSSGQGKISSFRQAFPSLKHDFLTFYFPFCINEIKTTCNTIFKKNFHTPIKTTLNKNLHPQNLSNFLSKISSATQVPFPSIPSNASIPIDDDLGEELPSPIKELKELNHHFKTHKLKTEATYHQQLKLFAKINKELTYQQIEHKDANANTTVQSLMNPVLMATLCFQRRLNALNILEQEIEQLLQDGEIDHCSKIANDISKAISTDNALISLLNYKPSMTNTIRKVAFDSLKHPLVKSTLTALAFGAHLYFNVSPNNLTHLDKNITHADFLPTCPLEPPTHNSFNNTPELILQTPPPPESHISPLFALTTLALPFATYAGITAFSNLHHRYWRSFEQNDSFPSAMMHMIGQISSSAMDLLELAELQDQKELIEQCATLTSNNQMTLEQLHQLTEKLLLTVSEKIDQISDKDLKNVLILACSHIEGLLEVVDILAGTRNQACKSDFSQFSSIPLPQCSIQSHITSSLQKLTASALWNPKTTLATIKSEEKNWPVKLDEAYRIYSHLVLLAKEHQAFVKNLDNIQQTIEFVRNSPQTTAANITLLNAESDVESDADSEEDALPVVKAPVIQANNPSSERMEKTFTAINKATDRLKLSIAVESYMPDIQAWSDISTIEKYLAVVNSANEKLEGLNNKAKFVKADLILDKLIASGFSQKAQDAVAKWKRSLNAPSGNNLPLKASFDKLMESVIQACKQDMTSDLRIHQSFIDKMWRKEGNGPILKRTTLTKAVSSPLGLTSLSSECCKAHYRAWMLLRPNLVKAKNLDELIALKQTINKTLATAKALNRLLTYKPSYHIQNLVVDCLNNHLTKSALAVGTGLYSGISTLKSLTIHSLLSTTLSLNGAPSALEIMCPIGAFAAIPPLTYAGITKAAEYYNKHWRPAECNSSFSTAVMYTLESISASFNDILALKYQDTKHEFTPAENQCMNLSSNKELTLLEIYPVVEKLLQEVKTDTQNSLLPDHTKEEIYHIYFEIKGLLDCLKDLNESHNQARKDAFSKLDNTVSDSDSDSRFGDTSDNSPSKEIIDKLIQSVSWTSTTTLATIETDEKDWIAKEEQVKKIYECFKSFGGMRQAFTKLINNPGNILPDLSTMLIQNEEDIAILQQDFQLRTSDIMDLKIYRAEVEKLANSMKLALTTVSQIKAEYDIFESNLHQIDEWVTERHNQRMAGNAIALEEAVKEIRLRHIPEDSSNSINSIAAAQSILKQIKLDNQKLPVILKEFDDNFKFTKQLRTQIFTHIQSFNDELQKFKEKIIEIEKAYQIDLTPLHRLVDTNNDKVLSFRDSINIDTGLGFSSNKNLADLNAAGLKSYKEELSTEITKMRSDLKKSADITKAYNEHQKFLKQCKKAEDRIVYLKSLKPSQLLAAYEIENELKALKNTRGFSWNLLIGSLPTTFSTFFKGMTLNPLTPVMIAARKVSHPIESMIWGVLLSGAHTARLKNFIDNSSSRHPSTSITAQLSAKKYNGTAWIPNMINFFPNKIPADYEHMLRAEFLKEVQAGIEMCKSKLELWEKNLDNDLVKYIHTGWYKIIKDHLNEKIDALYAHTVHFHVPRLWGHIPYKISMPFGFFRPSQYKFHWKPLYTSTYAVDRLDPKRLESYKTEMTDLTNSLTKILDEQTYLPNINKHHVELKSTLDRAKKLADSLETKKRPLEAEVIRAACRNVKKELLLNKENITNLDQMKILAKNLKKSRDEINRLISEHTIFENRADTIIEQIKALPENLSTEAAKSARRVIVNALKEHIQNFITNLEKSKEILKGLEEKGYIDQLWRDDITEKLESTRSEITALSKGKKVSPLDVKYLPLNDFSKTDLLTHYKAIWCVTSAMVEGRKNEAAYIQAIEQIAELDKLNKSYDELQRKIKEVKDILAKERTRPYTGKIHFQNLKALEYLLDNAHIMSDLMIQRLSCLPETKEAFKFIDKAKKSIDDAFKNIKANVSVKLGLWGQMKALELENHEITISPDYGTENVDTNTSNHMLLRDKILCGVDPISQQCIEQARAAAKKAIISANRYDLLDKEEENAIKVGEAAITDDEIRRSPPAEYMGEKAGAAAANYLFNHTSGSRNVIIATVARIAGDTAYKYATKNNNKYNNYNNSFNYNSNYNDFRNPRRFSVVSSDVANVSDSESFAANDNDSSDNLNEIDSGSLVDRDSDSDSDSITERKSKKVKPKFSGYQTYKPTSNVPGRYASANNSAVDDVEFKLKSGIRAAAKAVYAAINNFNEPCMTPKEKQMDAIMAATLGAAYYSFLQTPLTETPINTGELASKAVITALEALIQRNIEINAASEVRKIACIGAGFAMAAQYKRQNLVLNSNSARRIGAEIISKIAKDIRGAPTPSTTEVDAMRRDVANNIATSFDLWSGANSYSHCIVKSIAEGIVKNPQVAALKGESEYVLSAFNALADENIRYSEPIAKARASLKADLPIPNKPSFYAALDAALIHLDRKSNMTVLCRSVLTAAQSAQPDNLDEAVYASIQAVIKASTLGFILTASTAAADAEAIASDNDRDRINNAAIEAAVKTAVPIVRSERPSIGSVQGNLIAMENYLEAYEKTLGNTKRKINNDLEPEEKKYDDFEIKNDDAPKVNLALINDENRTKLLELAAMLKNYRIQIKKLKFGQINSKNKIINTSANLKSSHQLAKYGRECMRQCYYMRYKIDEMVKGINKGRNPQNPTIPPIALPKEFNWNILAEL